MISYIKESYNELMHKVSWPTWQELQNSAIVVMIASFIIAFVVYAMDAGTNFVVSLLYGTA